MTDWEFELGLGVIVSICGMLGMEMVVISGWVGLEQNALYGNGEIPSGSLGLRLLTSSIKQGDLGGGVG